MPSEHLIRRIELLIAEARQEALDPFEISIGDLIKIEIRPSDDRDSIYVCHESLGCTQVNYTDEGVSIDVFSADLSLLDPVFTQCVYMDDLESPEN